MFSRSFRIGLIQSFVDVDKTKSLENAVKHIENAKANGAQLVALPEYFNSSFDSKILPEEVPHGPTSKALSELASKLKLYIIGGSIPERDGNKIFNASVVWNPDGKLIAKHRKVHLYDVDIPGKLTYKESKRITAGDELTTFQYDQTKIGLGVCHDLRFEEMARMYSSQVHNPIITAHDQIPACSMLIYPGGFNFLTGPKHWEVLARARAIDNQCWTAVISPARDEKSKFVAWGHTSLINPWGEVVAELDEKEGILVHDIDLSMVEKVRAQLPLMHQRRTDLFETMGTANRVDSVRDEDFY